jgi:hypothetical protein
MANPTIDEDGTKRWCNKDGHLHREDGPAIVFRSGYEAWWLNGKLHREDGPAIIYSNGEKSYWLNDKQYTEDAFKTIQFFNGVKLND